MRNIIKFPLTSWLKQELGLLAIFACLSLVTLSALVHVGSHLVSGSFSWLDALLLGLSCPLASKAIVLGQILVRHFRHDWQQSGSYIRNFRRNSILLPS